MADLGLDVRLVAFHAHNQSSMTDKVVEWLQKGQQWALVSDAGTPLVSDPGSWLINTLWQKALPVEPIPGPSAPVAAYSVAGYPPRPTLFLGFLSPKPGKRRRELDKWRGHDIIAIVFESPHRVARLLADALEIWGNVPVTIAREMTKTHESYYRGRVADFWPAWRDERIKGELTLVFWLQG
jgi:16S rRNA (cytidine1402-2'-O)-methyltransferase